MILKASQRAGAGALATHLLNGHDNEHVNVHAISGFMGESVSEALHEIEAMSKGTRCKQYMFSVSLSPPPDVKATTKLFEHTIERIAKANGLENQPHVIVFHEKQGRRHAHCVWSRIDTAKMRAINLPHFKNKLMSISNSIYLEQGWALPQGHIDRTLSNPLNFNLAEWQQAKRQKRNPKAIKSVVRGCWDASRSKAQFEKRLEKHGFYIACGAPRRAFVIVDYEGEVRSLSRQAGVKTDALKSKLGEAAQYPSVDDMRAHIGGKLDQNIKRNAELLQAQHARNIQPLLSKTTVMQKAHERAREQLKTRQHYEELAQRQQLQSRLQKGWRGLWQRVTGKHRAITRHNEREAYEKSEQQKLEMDNLIFKQLEERQALQKQIDMQHQNHEQHQQAISQNMTAVFERSQHQKRDFNLSL